MHVEKTYLAYVRYVLVYRERLQSSVMLTNLTLVEKGTGLLAKLMMPRGGRDVAL